MQKILPIITGLLIGTVSFQTFTTYAQSYSDIAEHPYETEIEAMTEAGIFEGYSDGTFRPDQPINRAELMKILIEPMYPYITVPNDLRCFEDLNFQEPRWYSAPVCTASALGIVQGYPDGTFRPEQTVNLAEALKMVTLSYGISVQAEADAAVWYEPYVIEARNRGALVSQLGNPGKLLTRAEAAAILYAFNQSLDEEDDTNIPPSIAPYECGNNILEPGEQCDDGNTENSDGCSEICILVEEPTRHASILITQDATALITNAAVGRDDVTMLRFTATAGRQDALLTRLVFKPVLGSLVYAKNFTLAMDRDGDSTFETEVQAVARTENGLLIFDEMDTNGVELPVDLAIPFEVRADISNSLGPVTLEIAFATNESQYVFGVGAEDGRELTGIETNGICSDSICWISVVTGNSTQVSINEQGDLYVEQFNGQPPRRHALAGALSEEALRFSLRAEGENIEVTTLRIEGGSASIKSLKLYKNGEITPFAQATTTQCSTVTTTRFCADLGANALVIGFNQEVVIHVRADIKSDTEGGISNEQFTLRLSDSNTTFPAVEARGKSSLIDLDQTDGDSIAEGEIFVGRSSPGTNLSITAQPQTTTYAAFKSIINGSTLVDGTAVPVGQRDIGAFTFEALPHLNSKNGLNDVIIKDLVFHVSATNVQIDPASFRVYDKNSPSDFASCTGSATTGNITVTCSNLDSASIGTAVDQGSTLTLVLQGNITNPQTSGGSSTLVASIDLITDITWTDESQTFSTVYLEESTVSSTQFRNGF